MIALAGESLIPRRGSPKPTKRREGKGRRERRKREEGGRVKKKRRGIQLIILLAISVLCSSIISYTMLKAFLLIKFALPQTHAYVKIYVVSVVS